MATSRQSAANDALRLTCHPLTVAVLCGIPLLAQMLAASLEQSGLCVDLSATIVLLLDAPLGFAMAMLAGSALRTRHIVVTTANRCPEYWHNLSDMGAQIVIADEHAPYPLEDILRHAGMGVCYRVTTEDSTLLTPAQRRALHLLACGLSNQQIAARTRMKEQSVKNMLTEIYQKLQVADRHAAQNYYWGIWTTGLACVFPDESRPKTEL